MAKPSATDRVSRILAVIPWVAAEGRTPIATVCQRFQVTTKDLLADLAVVPFVGRYPYTPDTLIDLSIDDDHIEVVYGNYFERPLQLTRIEALSLLTAGRAATAQPGNDEDGPLARALGKVASVLGVAVDETLEVVLEGGGTEVQERLEQAVAGHRVVEADYFSHARNTATHRVLEPHRLFHADGAWYLDAHCRTSDAQRVFRLDRFAEVVVSDEVFEPAEPLDGPPSFEPGAEVPRVVLDLPPDGAWVAEQYPVDSVEARPDGRIEVRLGVRTVAWLERLLLRLGPDARVIEAPVELQATGPSAAGRLLRRYQDPGR